MSLRVRITIPDGELLDHLEGRSSKGMGMELIRLATNQLHISRNVETMVTHPVSIRHNEVSPSPSTTSDEVKAQEPIDDSKTSTGGLVNFGSDLIDAM